MPVGPSPGDTRIGVLVVIKSLALGGAERLLADTLASADHAAFRYEVALVRDDADGLAGEIESGGVPVHRLGARSNTDPRWALRLRRLLLAGRYDIVHFHLPFSAAFGRPAVLSLPKRRRPATLYTEHSMWDLVSPVTRLLNRATVGSDRAVVAVSPAAFDHLPPAVKGKARIVVHGVNLAPSRDLRARRHDVRSEVRSELGLSDDDLVALTVANLRPEKGYDVLLDAADILRQRGIALHFLSAGTGVLLDELTDRRRQLGLEDTVTFLGHRTDALRLMTAADMVVLPSHQEGLPVVLMEATSVGAPVVASAIGGVPLVLTDEVSGLLVTPGDPRALADALARVCADPDLRRSLGNGALATSDQFDVSRAAGELEALYRTILGR